MAETDEQLLYQNYQRTGGGMSIGDWRGIGSPLYYQPKLEPLEPKPEPEPEPKPEPEPTPVSDEQLLYQNYQRTGGGMSIGDWRGIGSPLFYQPKLEPKPKPVTVTTVAPVVTPPPAPPVVPVLSAKEQAEAFEREKNLRDAAIIKLHDYLDPATQNLKTIEAVEGGISRSVMVQAGYQIDQAEYNKIKKQIAERKTATGKLSDFIDPKTQNLRVHQAIEAGVSREIMVTAGYEVSKVDYNKATTELKVHKTAMVSLEKYKVKDADGAEAYLLSQYLMDNKENLTSASNTLKQAGFNVEQIKVARDATQEAIQEAIELEKRPEWIKWVDEKVTGVEKWTTNLLTGIRETSKEAEPGWDKAYATFASGITTVAVSVATAIPILLGRAIINPTGIPKMAWDTGKGMVLHVSNTASNLSKNAYGKDLVKGDIHNLVFDTTMSYLIISGGYRATKAIVSKITTYVAPRGVPASVIAKEASTGRIPASVKNFRTLAQAQKYALKYGDAIIQTIKRPNKPPTYAVQRINYVRAMADAINKVEKLASQKGGKFTGEVIIEGTPYKLRYLKTPIQQKVGNILWHGTKDEVAVAGTLAKESLLKIAQRQGRLVVGKGGLYTDPWAAVAYTRGQNPGLLMIITDASKIKTGARGFKTGISQSDKFIRGADKGFYGSSKGWRGDFETEIVGAPGTKIMVPAPSAGLLTRLLAGKYADFFTYDAGKYVPIKIGIHSTLIKAGVIKAPTIADLYAAKLMVLKNALRDTVEAIKHPGAVLADVSGTFKALIKLDGLARGSKGSSPTLPGVRDVYLITNWGTKLKMLTQSLIDRVLRKTKAEIPKGTKTTSRLFKEAFERNLDDIYTANARLLIQQFKGVATAYGASESVRAKFEASYLAHLGITIESLARTSSQSQISVSEVSSDARIKSPEVRSIATSDEPAVSTTRTVETPKRPKTPRTPVTTEVAVSSVREPRTPTTRTPVTREEREERRRREERVERETPVTERPVTRREREEREIPKKPPVTLVPPPVKGRRKLTSATRLPEGTIVWYSGKPSGVELWVTLAPPWGRHDARVMVGRPKGARVAPFSYPDSYNTIQKLGKAPVPETLVVDVGNQDVTIHRPTNKPGRKGAIKFERDIGVVTTSQLTTRKRFAVKKKKRASRRDTQSISVSGTRS